MEYKVIPIVPVLNKGEHVSKLAQDYEATIKKYIAEGYEYVATENLKTWVNGDNGCFGIIGATRGHYSEAQMLVFRK